MFNAKTNSRNQAPVCGLDCSVPQSQTCRNVGFGIVAIRSPIRSSPVPHRHDRTELDASPLSQGEFISCSRVEVDLRPPREIDDVEKLFGQPFRTGTDDGDVTWTYVDYHLRLFGPQEARDLHIRFDKSGKVKSYAFNTSD